MVSHYSYDLITMMIKIISFDCLSMQYVNYYD